MKSEITLPISELKNALTGLNKLVGRKTTLPVLSHIRISRSAQGDVQLQGTDLDGFATYTVTGQQPGEAVEVLLPLEQLNKASKCGGKHDLALLIDGKTTKLRYSLAGNLVEQPVNTWPMDEWPAVPKIEVKSTLLEPSFGQALQEALASCSEDPTRQTLRGACLDARDAKAHYIVGTNGRMLFAANSFTFPLKEAVIVPDSKFITGSGLFNTTPCFLAVQPGKKPEDIKHICLRNQRWQFITREVEGKYPNWKQVVPEVDAKWTKIKLPPTAIDQLLQVIPKLPGHDRKDKDIRLCIEKQLCVEGRTKDDTYGTSIPIPDAIITGKHMFISLNRDYLLNALKFGLNEWAVEDELTPLVASRDGKRMVIMPVRPPIAITQTKPTPAPTETTPPAPEPTQERKTDMPKTSTKTEPTKPTSLIDEIESIKDSLKQVIHDLSDFADTVKLAEKQKRTNEKEVEAARATLKKLQQVTI